MNLHRTLTILILTLALSAGAALAQPGAPPVQQPPVQQPSGQQPSGQQPSGQENGQPASAPAPAADSPNPNNSTEFVGGMWGVGTAGGEVGMGGAIRVGTVRWERFAWTIIDVFATAGVSDFEQVEDNSECMPLVEDCTISAETGLLYFGTRLYYKTNRDPMGRRQVWWGFGAGILAEDRTTGDNPTGNSEVRLSLSPSVDYVIQTDYGLFYGVGVRVATAFGERFHTGRLPFISLVGVTIGMTPGPLLRKQISTALAGR